MIISGTYIISTTRPTVSVHFCLVVCFIDIFTYIIYIIRERKNVRSYMMWSHRELQKYYTCLFKWKTTEMGQYTGYQHEDENDLNHRYLDSECLSHYFNVFLYKQVKSMCL